MRSFKLSQFVTRRVFAIAAAGALVLATLVFMPLAQASAAPAAPAAIETTPEKHKFETATETAKARAKSASLPAYSFANGPRALQGLAPVLASAPSSQLQPSSFGATGAAKISGRLLTTAGAPVANAMVVANGERGEYWTTTTSTGNYVLTGLVAGTYVVFFDAATAVTVKNLTTSENRLKVDAKIALKAQIKGAVTGAGGVVPDVLVQVYSAANPDQSVAWTYSDANGNYFIHGLAAGTYKVKFDTEYVSAASYLDEWSSNKSSHETADVLTLGATTVLTSVNEVLASGATIRGITKDMAGYGPRPVTVELFPASGDDQPPVARAIPGDDGIYYLRGIPEGSYKLKALGSAADAPAGHRDTWWPRASSSDEASAIAVAALQSVGLVSINLLPGTTISGRVSAVGVAGVANVGVSAVPLNDEYGTAAYATTDASGNYTLRGLEYGQYKVRFDAQYATSASYATQWSTGRSSFLNANVIDVTHAAAAGVNATLVKAALITGVVKNTSGAAVANASITVRSSSNEWDFVAFAQTDSKGVYTVRGLAAGTYKVRVDTYDVTSGSYFGAWFGGKTTFATATSVTLTAVLAKTGVNVTLAKAAQISGKVTGIAGAPVRGILVEAYAPSGETYGTQVETDYLGNYTVRGLPAGTYKLFFNAETSRSGSYLSQWYNQQSSLADATGVAVTTAQLKTGINTVLSAGSSLKGVVTNVQGSPIRGVVVHAYDRDTGEVSARGVSDGAGNYSLHGLSDARQYSIFFDTEWVTSGSYFDKWMGGATDMLTAYPVTPPTASLRIAAVIPDEALPDAPSITGRVVNALGEPLGRASLSFHDSTVPPEDSVATVESDMNGYYTVRGIAAGTYKVMVDTWGISTATYLSEWAGSAPHSTFDTATVLTVTGTSTLNHSNIVVTKAAKITGNVISATGVALAGVDLEVFDAADEYSPIAFAETDKLGNFVLDGLAAGSYKVQIDPRELKTASYRLSWADRKENFDSASVYSLATGESINLTDTEALSGAQISGKVIEARGGKAIANVTVNAYSATGQHEWVSTAYTDAAGNYVLRGLPAGTYKVEFDGNDETPTSYLPAWFGNAATAETAAVIKLASQQVKTSVNYSLVRGATVSGRVVDANGDGVEGVYVYPHGPTNGLWNGAIGRTDELGNYVLKGVPATGFRLWFDGTQIEGAEFGDIWNSNRPSWATADTITVPVGTTRANINVVMPTVTWTSISGDVGNAGDGAVVEAFDSDSVLVGSAIADADGHYEIQNLPPGTYRVRAVPNAVCFTYNWHSAGIYAGNFASAEDVEVGFRQNTPLPAISLVPIMTDACA